MTSGLTISVSVRVLLLEAPVPQVKLIKYLFIIYGVFQNSNPNKETSCLQGIGTN